MSPVRNVSDPQSSPEAEGLNPDRQGELSAYLNGARPSPTPGVDLASGRAIPISDEERRARFEDLKRQLEEINAKDHSSEDEYVQFMRNLDEERRLQGRPPAFEGYH
ncbi:MAG TPA: hypothetical protein VGZ22_29895 [Isosphaeraceae bacterium]|jgi:hypothetical protein|nr:hypothetical protein [Isosphaeraceae bacterium]